MNAQLQEIVELMNWFDWVLITMITISGLYGLVRGFVKEALTITAWGLAAWLSYLYAEPLSGVLSSHIATASLRVALMVLMVFMLVLSATSLLRSGMNYLIAKVGLTGLDSLMGCVFGLLRGAVISILILIALLNLGFSKDSWWQESYMVERLVGVMQHIPEHLPQEAKGVYERYAFLP